MLALVSFICFAPSAFGVTFAKSAGESTKRATAHDYDDRNIPDVFDIVYYDTHGRDGLPLYTTHVPMLNTRIDIYLLKRLA